MGASLLAAGDIDRDALHARQACKYKNFIQPLATDLHHAVVAGVLGGALSVSLSRQDGKGRVKRVAHEHARLRAGLQGFIQRGAEMRRLLPRALPIREIGLGSVDKVEPQHELVATAVHMEAVAIVVLVRHVAAVGEGRPLFPVGRDCLD